MSYHSHRIVLDYSFFLNLCDKTILIDFEILLKSIVEETTFPDLSLLFCLFPKFINGTFR